MNDAAPAPVELYTSTRNESAFSRDLFLRHSSMDEVVVRTNNNQLAGSWIDRLEEWLADSGVLKRP